QLLGDTQSQSSAAELPSCRGVDLGKGQKELGQLSGGNTDSGVSHAKAQNELVAIGLGVDSEPDLAGRGEFDRIAQQIQKNLAEPVRVRMYMDGKFWGQFAIKLPRFIEELPAYQVEAVLDQRCQLERPWVQFQFARLDFGQIEDVVDQGQQVLATGLDGLDIIQLLGIQVRVQQQFGGADHAIHGRTDFMADGRQKVAFGPVSNLGGFLGLGQGNG